MRRPLLLVGLAQVTFIPDLIPEGAACWCCTFHSVLMDFPPPFEAGLVERTSLWLSITGVISFSFCCLLDITDYTQSYCQARGTSMATLSWAGIGMQKDTWLEMWSLARHPKPLHLLSVTFCALLIGHCYEWTHSFYWDEGAHFISTIGSVMCAQFGKLRKNKVLIVSWLQRLLPAMNWRKQEKKDTKKKIEKRHT